MSGATRSCSCARGRSSCAASPARAARSAAATCSTSRACRYARCTTRAPSPRCWSPCHVKGVNRELAAAHAAVDEAVALLRARRDERHTRTAKAAKDFLTEVDTASEALLKRALSESTPDIGFYGEEGGGADLHAGRVWVVDPLDGTINYATGSPLCGVMVGLLEDGVPVLGVIDLPFLGTRVDSTAAGPVVDVDAFDEGI